MEADKQDHETGRVAGIEIVGFLEFDKWDALPDLGVLWQLPGQEAQPLAELLKQQQRELREEAAAVSSGTG